MMKEEYIVARIVEFDGGGDFAIVLERVTDRKSLEAGDVLSYSQLNRSKDGRPVLHSVGLRAWSKGCIPALESLAAEAKKKKEAQP